jgi:O-antigen/teichoic acid export membrane protein
MPCSRIVILSARLLVRNTAVNALGRVINAALAIALTPYLLHRLGAAQFGVWTLATTLTFTSGYLSLAELGLQQAAVRLIAAARARNDTNAMNEVLSTTLWVYTALGVVLGAALVAVAGVLTHLFNVGEPLAHAARLTFAVIGLQLAVDLPCAALYAFLEGVQRYGTLRAVDVGSRLVWAAAVAAAVVLGHGVVALAVMSLATAVLALVLAGIAAQVVTGPGEFRITSPSRRTLRVLARSGSSLLVLRVLGVLYSQMDRAIIGIALTAVAVARYEVIYKIHATAALGIGVAASALMPASAYLAAADDDVRLREMFLRGTRYAIAFVVPISVAGIVYARALIRTWVGAEYVGLTGAAQLFLVYPVLAVVVTVGQTMLVGLNRMREMLQLQVIAVAVNLGLSIALVRPLGVIGVVWGTVIAYVIQWVPLTRVFLAQFGVSVAVWVRSVVVPTLVPLVAQVAFGIATVGIADRASHLWGVAALFGASYLVAIAVFAAVSMDASERRQLFDAARVNDAGAGAGAGDGKMV